MSDPVIQVNHLSKRFNIGKSQARYRTFRDVISTSLAAPVQRLRHLIQGNHYGASDLTETIWALKDISFEVQRGDVVGVIGRNGAGKSTLLKILARITEPTEGSIDLYGRVGSLLEVGTGFHAELTGRENIFLNGAILGMKRQEINQKFDEIVAFSEIEKFIDTPVKHYSTGMYLRLAFAVAAHLEPEILLVDEVLAVGDAAFQKKCLGKMGEVAKEGRTVLFVSHNMRAIQRLCTTGLVIDHGIITCAGPINDAIGMYENILLSTANSQSGSLPAHVLYQKDGHPDDCIEITAIELLDPDDWPKPVVSTWDSFKIRIHYHANQTINAGSMVLRISTRDGVPLVLLSTQPDSSVEMQIRTGDHFADCEFTQIPLAAGDYIVGCGLAIPNKEWLFWKDDLGVLAIHPQDVYHSGLAPAYPRSLLAISHAWKIQ